METTPTLNNSEAHTLPEPVRRVVRIGWVMMALLSLWTFSWTLKLTWELIFNPSPRIAQGYADLGISATLVFVIYTICLLISYVTHFTVAVLLFVRLPNDRMALFVAVFIMAFGTANSYPATAEFLQVYSSDRLYYVIPFQINNMLGWPLLVVFFALYPDGVFVPRGIGYIALYGFVFSVLWGVFPQAFGTPSGWLAVFITVSIILIFGGSLYAQIYRYRNHSTPLQRQQTKWMVYSFALVMVIVILQQVLLVLVVSNPAATPTDKVVLDFIVVATGALIALIPVAIGIAILRYRLYDIDLLIRRTITYSVITALLALIYLGGVVMLQNIFIGLTGQNQSQLVIVISTLTIAALFLPLRTRVQEFIDRRFYRQKYDAAKTLAEFASAARDEVELEKLTGRLVQVVDETMQPQTLSLWLHGARSGTQGTADAQNSSS